MGLLVSVLLARLVRIKRTASHEDTFESRASPEECLSSLWLSSVHQHMVACNAALTSPTAHLLSRRLIDPTLQTPVPNVETPTP